MFQGKSEYDRHYVWRDSYLSKTFHPTPQQSAESAGVQSAYIGCSIQKLHQKILHASQRC